MKPEYELAQACGGSHRSLHRQLLWEQWAEKAGQQAAAQQFFSGSPVVALEKAGREAAAQQLLPRSQPGKLSLIGDVQLKR